MKKLYALLLALALVFSLASCGETASNGSSSAAGEASSVSSEVQSESQGEEAAVYTYVEDRGDFQVTWTLTTNPDGSFILAEANGMSGETTNHTGTEWTDNGDGTITTGAWDDATSNKSEFFAEDGSCTWTVDGANIAPAEAGAEGGEEAAAPAIYNYVEDRGDFQVTWTLTTNPDGTFVLAEANGMSGETTNHTGSEWTDNGDGTISTGAWDDATSNKSEFFAEDGSCTWSVDGANIAPAEAGAEGGEEAAAPATYNYVEDRGDFQVTWTLTTNPDGTFILAEANGMSGETTNHTGSEWTDNGDGTITTGAWDDATSNKSEFFGEDGSCTWTVDGDAITPAE